MLTVHDEIDISAPKKALKREMLRLRDIMMSVEFDVPMLSEGEVGARWSELEELKEPEPNLSAWS
jgi:DNA polymerase I-like protein with 3'-5' exonuclease and polymerase domains